MKIFMLTAYLGGFEKPVYPLGLAYLKSALDDHDVDAIDLNVSKNPFQELIKRLLQFTPHVVGISLRNIDSTNKRTVIFYYKYLKETVDVIKSCSDAFIIIGGSGFSMFTEEIMADEPRIDYGVYLEGESTFKKLLVNLETPEKVPSVLYRRNGIIYFSGPGPLLDFSRINRPDFEVLPIEDYRQFPGAIGIETKRGCMLKCVYCIYPFLNGKHYRLKNAEEVVNEIEYLVKHKHIQQFMFVDSVFNIPKKHAEDVCHELIKRRVPVRWSAWLSEKAVDHKFIRLMQKAGCNHVSFSPDGFDNRVLKRLGKSIKSRNIRKAFSIMAQFPDMELSYNFFKNPPGQTLYNFTAIIGFLIKAKLRMRGRVHFELNSLRIEPHTRLEEIAVAENMIKNNENLLVPKYYTHQKTWYIEKFLDLLLRIKGK
jgi:5-methoxybenzimidazole methyltransferase